MQLRSSLVGFGYRHICKPIFFRFDPEVVHDFIIKFGSWIEKHSALKKSSQYFFNFSHSQLEQTILGIKFKNPIGLAAGFVKNAELLDLLPAVGFGFVEIGSITAKSCAGNPKPRLWRLPKKHSLQVYYGLKNDGADTVHDRLKNRNFQFPIGISIAKTNERTTTLLEQGIEDYFYSYVLFQDTGDYFTINISCPNTYEVTSPFLQPQHLEKLLKKINSIQKSKPIFIKLSPDLNQNTETLIDVCLQNNVDGFICSNLTKQNISFTPGKGGLSGKSVEKLSNKLIASVYKKTAGQKIIIGCGGIFSAEDAYTKIRLGANVVQLITGMIFEGPQLIGDINRRLVKLLQRDGFKNISEAVGVGV